MTKSIPTNAGHGCDAATAGQLLDRLADWLDTTRGRMAQITMRHYSEGWLARVELLPATRDVRCTSTVGEHAGMEYALEMALDDWDADGVVRRSA